jgi:hypothetical protein
MPWPWSSSAKVAPGPADVPKKYIEEALKQMTAEGKVTEARDDAGNRTPDDDFVDGDELMRRAKELMAKKGGRGRTYRRRRRRHTRRY